MKKLFFFALSLSFLLACQREAADQWKPLDLMPYGIPLSVQAPDSAKVKVSDLGVIKDVTITGGEDYSIQLFASGAETTDVARIKAGELADVKANRLFSKIVEEEEAGFIYETKIDTLASFGFRYIRVQGDMECVFQTGLVGTFSLEEARRMYDAVKVRK